MSVIIDTTKSEVEAVLRYARIGANNCMIGNSWEIVPLVRCKDCKHWYNDADTGTACEFTNLGQPPDGYCNWGERRSE